MADETPKPNDAAPAGKPAPRRSMGPFDHPWFLPGLLYLFTLWFAYDGWINQDPEMMEHQTFNRVGAVIWAVGAVYYTIQNIRDQRRARERAARTDSAPTQSG